MDPRHAENRPRSCMFDEGSCKAGDCPDHGIFPVVGPPSLREAVKLPPPRVRVKSSALEARQKRAPRIMLSVKLDDGTFDSALAIPTDADPEVIKDNTEAWLKMIEAALLAAKR